MQHETRNMKRGFSLIELLVVITMLSLLIGAALFAINPVEQLNKARNSQRQQDLHNVKTALDSYYNDHNCYPTSVPFGSSWTDTNGVSYMKLVPQDPACTTGGYCYYYQIDSTSACPQWNVLYGALVHISASSNANKTFCSLEQLQQCVPRNYSSLGYNYCELSGTVDCSYIYQSLLPTPGVPAIPTATPGPTSQPTNSPTGVGGNPTGVQNTPTPPIPTVLPPGSNCSNPNFACTAQSVSNPLGVCNNVGSGASGQPHYCGFGGCTGNACCDDACSQ